MPATPRGEPSVGTATVERTTFFGDSSTLSGARPIAVTAGETEVADIQLLSSSISSVKGRLTADGLPLRGATVRLFQTGDVLEGAAPPIESAVGATDSDGRFKIFQVPEGAYELRADFQETVVVERHLTKNELGFAVIEGSTTGLAQSAEHPRREAIAQVIVDRTTPTEVALTLSPGPSVKGRVTSASPTFLPSRVVKSVTLSSRSQDAQLVGSLSDTGEFEFSGAASGTYDVSADVDGGWLITKVVADGLQSQGMTVRLATATTHSIEIVLSPANTRVAGTVTPYAADRSIMVFAFPADRGMWSNSGALRQRAKVMFPDPNGAFSTENVPIGNYSLVALAAPAFEMDWRDFETLESLDRMSIRVTVANTASLNVTLRPRNFQR